MRLTGVLLEKRSIKVYILTLTAKANGRAVVTQETKARQVRDSRENTIKPQ